MTGLKSSILMGSIIWQRAGAYGGDRRADVELIGVGLENLLKTPHRIVGISQIVTSAAYKHAGVLAVVVIPVPTRAYQKTVRVNCERIQVVRIFRSKLLGGVHISVDPLTESQLAERSPTGGGVGGNGADGGNLAGGELDGPHQAA